MNDNNLKPAKQGEVRNPNGKKKGTLSYKTIIKKYLNARFKPIESGFEIPFVNENRRITLHEMIVLRMIKKAIETGDHRVYETLMNRGFGLLTQKTDITSKGEKINYDNISNIINTIKEQIIKQDDIK